MKTKTEDHRQHPASNYLIVGDVDEPSTWHLRVRNTFGHLDFKLLGDAWAALHEGFRGQKYQGPDKAEAIQKLKALYHAANMRTPGGDEPPVTNRSPHGRIVVCNRAFESDGGWIHIVPKGELPNSAAGIVQVLDDKSMDAILENIKKARNRLGDRWPGIYGGREHFIYDENKDSEALAWFKDFEKRSDGIWASEDGLTDIGREAIRNKRYKYTSFVADRSDLEKLDGNRHRVMGIDTVGFTNMANGKELLAPITNRDGDAITQAVEDNARNSLSGAGAKGNPLAAADPLTPEQRSMRTKAYEKWFETIGNVQRTAVKKTGHHMGFQWVWDHCKAEYPHIYEAAFGNITDASAAQSDAEAGAAAAEAGTIANRVGALAGRDFHFGWQFVKEHLPQVFNRQFRLNTPIANRVKVDESNMAGVQKKAERLFSELVQAEQNQCGVSYSHAFSRVTNRDRALRDLANYTISPREAFERDPELREKLMGAAGESKTPDDGTVRANAMRLFNRLVSEEQSSGASLMVAHNRVRAKHVILCKLVNREIAPKGAFVMEPELRDKLK